MSLPEKLTKETLNAVIDDAWNTGAKSGMQIIKNALVQAADAMPSKVLAATDIAYIIDGIIEVTEKGKK